MTVGSGRCHGPGCTRDARVEFFCGELCQAAWARQFAGRAVNAVPGRPLHIDILGDLPEQPGSPTPAFREAIRNLGASMGGIGAVGAGLGACGVSRSIASASAAFPQVASGEPLDTNPQVTDNNSRSEHVERGLIRRALDVLYRRGE